MPQAIAPFNLADAVDHGIGEARWKGLRTRIGDVDAEGDVQRVGAVMELWARRKAQPHELKDASFLAAARREVRELRWEADERQQLFLGEVRADGEDEGGRGEDQTEEDRSAREAEAGGLEEGEERGRAADRWAEAGPAEGDWGGRAPDGQGQAAAWADAMRWPGGGRRVPSLAPDGGGGARRSWRGSGRVWVDVTRVRQCVDGRREGGAWRMDHDCVLETRAAGAEPLAALFGRWEEAESPWAAGGDRAKRRLCRGLTTREADALQRGEGLTTRQHSGRDADHAASIADHRGSDGRGLSFSKEVLTCARYAKGGSGKVVFVAVGGLRPDWLHDYATTEGAARLRAAAASPAAGARAERFALADLEVRYDGSVPREAVTWVADLSDWLGDEHAFAGGSKREFASSARRALRDAAARGAAAAEGRDVPWVGGDGPALRMSVDEGETLSTAATAAMAHMALTLHEEYRFTDACATDGSRIPRPAGARAGTVHGSARVAWGVFRGVGRTRGGALAAGASVQDAEMEAIRRCLRWVAEEAVQDGGLVQRRVLVLGDSIGVLQDIEAVWRMGTAEAFRLRNRRGMMEDIIRLRRELGAVVFQWVRGHGGVHCNAHADMIAKACLDEGVEDSVGEQRATTVRYEIRSETGGSWAGVPADRRPLRLLETRVQRWLTLQWRTDREQAEPGGGTVDALLLDDAWLDGGGGAYWTQLVRRSGEGGRRSGSRGTASDVGAVMMLRSGRLGLPAEYTAERQGDDAVGAMLAAQARAEPGEGPADKLRAILGRMAEVVPGTREERGAGKRKRMSALKAALDGAAAFVEGLGEGRRPSPQLWDQARRIFTGFWPVPSREDWGEAGGDDAASGAAGEDGEGVATRGARAATLLVRDAAWVVWAAARDARQREAQQGEGGARRRAGDEEGGSDEEDADDDSDSEGEDVTDDEEHQGGGQGTGGGGPGGDGDSGAGPEDDGGRGDGAGASAEGGGGGGRPTPAGGASQGGRGAASSAAQRRRTWTILVPPGYVDGGGQTLAADLGGRRTTFRLPDGVRPGDRVVIELTACGEVAHVSTPGAAAPRGAAAGGAARGRGRGRGRGAGARQGDGGRGAEPVQEGSGSESEGYVDPSERTQVRVRKVRSDKGVKRGPRAGAVEDAVRMGPVVRLRLEHGYGRELPPRHAEMLQGNGERPDWAREFGSGNSGDEDARRATGWRDRVREAAVRAEREARLARAEEAAEAREERAARAAAEDLPGGGELAVDGRTGRAEGEALCLPEGEGPGEAGEGGGGGEVIEVRAYEEGGEPRGDEARPEPRLQPRQQRAFTSKKAWARREGRGLGETGGPPGTAAGGRAGPVHEQRGHTQEVAPARGWWREG